MYSMGSLLLNELVSLLKVPAKHLLNADTLSHEVGTTLIALAGASHGHQSVSVLQAVRGVIQHDKRCSGTERT